MNKLTRKACYVLAAFALSCGSLSAADVAVDIEVAMAPGVPITAPQEWAERLGKLGFDRVQIRSARGEEKPSAELNDTGTRIKVIALLGSKNELVFAERKFGIGDLGQLRKYIEGLPKEVAEQGVIRGPFGLIEEQFHVVMNELKRPLAILSVGKNAKSLVEQCQSKFRLPMRIVEPASLLLADGEPLAIELSEFASGTALSIALRRNGLTIRPQLVNRELQLVVEPYERGRQVWPAGWKAEQTPRQITPKLYEQLTIEIEGYTLASALTALAPRIVVPVVMDDWILKQKGIDPAKVAVKVPAKKTYLKNALDRIFSQTRLSCDLRIDDAGKPFLWATQYGPDSRPAW